MTIEYLKRAHRTPASGGDDTRATVLEMLRHIETGGEARARLYAQTLDGWDGDIVVTRETIEAAGKELRRGRNQSTAPRHGGARRRPAGLRPAR